MINQPKIAIILLSLMVASVYFLKKYLKANKAIKEQNIINESLNDSKSVTNEETNILYL